MTHDIVHYTSAAIPVGPVQGKIDWARRIDHMQQHTGQHLLSAAFIELFGFQTKSFHLGRLTSTIDLEAPSIIRASWKTRSAAPTKSFLRTAKWPCVLALRRNWPKPASAKPSSAKVCCVRSRSEGFDRQPCGGTHLARTGQAGLLLIRKLERSRNLWRVEYVAGFRALSAARSDFGILTQAGSAC